MQFILCIFLKYYLTYTTIVSLPSERILRLVQKLVFILQSGVLLGDETQSFMHTVLKFGYVNLLYESLIFLTTEPTRPFLIWTHYKKTEKGVVMYYIGI